MASIALICEGVSEKKMLSYIVERYLGEDVNINAIQPPVTLSHQQEKQDDNGGWLQVLIHCTDEIVTNALAANDYLIVQIDTDTCNQKNYDVNVYDDKGNKVADEVLYNRVVERLKQNISEEVLATNSSKMLFAICINETECWLLPLLYENDAKKRCSTTNCIYILNQKLQKEGLGIPAKDKNSPKAIQAYQKVLKKMKKKDIPKIAQYNLGFKKFVEQLDGIKNTF